MPWQQKPGIMKAEYSTAAYTFSCFIQRIRWCLSCSYRPAGRAVVKDEASHLEWLLVPRPQRVLLLYP